jgi:Family of unknown function (DUF5304)
MAAERGESLGSAADEAARLLGALQDWARRASPGDDIPIATGAPECRLCPVCQLIGLMRDTSPEVVDHLARAGDALLAALRAAVVAHERSWSHGTTPDVEHIDIG